MMKTVGVFLIFMALIVGAVPLFTDCQAQGNAMTLANGRSTPMICHWTAEAEIAVAIPLLFVGSLLVFSHRRETLRALSILGVVLGVFVILLPTNLIGVCMGPDMLCNMLMKPILVFTGALITAASATALLAAQREVSEPVSSEEVGQTP
jgi:hypothetical protein